jgi:hypothetical protein
VIQATASKQKKRTARAMSSGAPSRLTTIESMSARSRLAHRVPLGLGSRVEREEK